MHLELVTKQTLSPTKHPSIPSKPPVSLLPSSREYQTVLNKMSLITPFLSLCLLIGVQGQVTTPATPLPVTTPTPTLPPTGTLPPTPTSVPVTLPPTPTLVPTPDPALIGVTLPLNILTGQGPLGGDRPPLLGDKDKPWSLVAVGLGPGANIVDLQVLKFPPLPRNQTYVRYYNGSAYTLLLDGMRPWMESVLTCKSYGLEPAPVHSGQEFGHLSLMMREKYQVMKDASHAEPGAWTGANDILEEGNYTNIHDGTLFSSYGGYTYTSNYGCSFTPYQGRCTTENCLSIMYYVTFPFMIDDRGCESALYTLCKEKSYN